MHSIRSDVGPLDPSLVPLFITEIDIKQYTQVAILTLLVYNAVITMDKEIKYFWNCYIGIFGAISVIVCSLLIILKGLSFFWIQGLANILLIRVLALYHQNKRLAACLRTVFGLEAVFDLALLIYLNIYEQVVVGELAEGITVCGVNREPPKVWSSLSWAVPMVYGIILMVLALYKAAEHWRETAGFNQLFIPNILLAELLNVLGSPSLLCVLGSHLLVHLKEAGERGANGGTSYRMRTMSNIEFS
ncbi:hypothetical protein DFH11DRAFT_1545911 [Phellopilus nigrolimitatus]|nr:hypothetical protein DFH11DRAFT_1545911 [Phellopilus nigrolimitatus]